MSRHRRIQSPLIAVVVSAALLAAACSEPEEETGAVATTAGSEDEAQASTTDPDTDSETTEPPATDDAPESTDASNDTGEGDGDPETEPQPVDDGSVVFDFAGEQWFLGEVPAAAVAADADADPIKIGMINQENTPLGSFPEVRGAAQTAVAWINAELGGVDDRPIELITCVTSFSVEQSQGCAQDMVQEGVVALVGGIDVTSNGSIPVLQQNGLPVVGGIPANLVEQRSETNFFFSGGTAGGMAAMIAHAASQGAESVMIAYGEFESFEVTSRDFAAPVAESLGMRVELQPFPIVGADMLQVLTSAADADVDALIVAAADTSCVPTMEGAVQLELRSQLYLVGACAAETILEAAGEAAAGVIYSGEGPPDPGDVEGAIYDAAVLQYAEGPAGGAGTVGFRSMMNLYALMTELGGDNIDSDAITELVRDAVDRPSFWGHSYTCDGERIPGLPALCAPEQGLFMTTGVVGEDLVFLPEGFEATDGWIEVDDLYRAALT
jgi:branched-chain amino acid transport system substrate-binding protein